MFPRVSQRSGLHATVQKFMFLFLICVALARVTNAQCVFAHFMASVLETPTVYPAANLVV